MKDAETKEVSRDKSTLYGVIVFAYFVIAAVFTAVQQALVRAGVSPKTHTGFLVLADNNASFAVLIFGLLLVSMLATWTWMLRGNDGVKVNLTAAATTFVGACFAAANSLDNGWFLLTGVVIGIATCIFALRKLEGVVSAGKLFVITGAQLLALFLLLT